MNMNRIVLAILVCGVAVPASVRAQESITFYNRKSGAKEVVKGVIQSESVQGIKIKPTKDPERLIPGADILEVTYYPPSPLTGPEMRVPFNRENEIFKATKPDERAKKIEDTLASYRLLIPKL